MSCVSLQRSRGRRATSEQQGQSPTLDASRGPCGSLPEESRTAARTKPIPIPRPEGMGIHVGPARATSKLSTAKRPDRGAEGGLSPEFRRV